MSATDQLRKFLSRVRTGKLSEAEICTVKQYLAACWEELACNDEGGMKAYKLHKYAEDMDWQPPILSFKIERHGGVPMGSTRGEIQSWNVDVEKGICALVGRSYRQLVPMSPRLDVKPIAAEITTAISNGQHDPRIKWSDDKRVTILVSKVIPETFKQTTRTRRQRFARELERLLKPQGWRRRNPMGPLIFERAG